jgi:hypothetical protein
MYQSYKSFWPDNEVALAADVQKARNAAKDQK